MERSYGNYGNGFIWIGTHNRLESVSFPSLTYVGGVTPLEVFLGNHKQVKKIIY